MKYEFVSAFERREKLIPLFEEYAKMLVETDPVFLVSLEQQHYDVEIARLEEKYAAPRGRIYLLYVDGALAGCVGMLTDSRSFLSYARHEYFRRILCELLGSWVENGEYPKDENALRCIIEGICVKNAERYFDL